MRELIVSVLTVSGLVAGAGSVVGCAGGSGAGARVGDSPPSRIGGFLGELIGYLGRRDLIDVGDPAPDFELTPLRSYEFDLGEPDAEANLRQDPYQAVRLSAFAGKRPVALVFGSYT